MPWGIDLKTAVQPQYNCRVLGSVFLMAWKCRWHFSGKAAAEGFYLSKLKQWNWQFIGEKAILFWRKKCSDMALESTGYSNPVDTPLTSVQGNSRQLTPTKNMWKSPYVPGKTFDWQNEFLSDVKILKTTSRLPWIYLVFISCSGSNLNWTILLLGWHEQL